jgi:hypothetical protein
MLTTVAKSGALIDKNWAFWPLAKLHSNLREERNLQGVDIGKFY